MRKGVIRMVIGIGIATSLHAGEIQGNLQIDFGGQGKRGTPFQMTVTLQSS